MIFVSSSLKMRVKRRSSKTATDSFIACSCLNNHDSSIFSFLISLSVELLPVIPSTNTHSCGYDFINGKNSSFVSKCFLKRYFKSFCVFHWLFYIFYQTLVPISIEDFIITYGYNIFIFKFRQISIQLSFNIDIIIRSNFLRR